MTGRTTVALAALLLLSAVAGTVASGAAAGVAPATRVNVTLYGEALCPYCAAFMTDNLAPLLKAGFDELVTFRYVAWGNAVNSAEGGVQCQHGPVECRLNRVINCAADLNPGQAPKLPWVFQACLEGAKGGAEGMEGAVEGCAEEAGLDAAAIQACAEGPQGDALERAAAEETAALQPPHQWVPWVVVQGITLGEDLDSLWRYICVALTGQRPAACFAPPPSLAGAGAFDAGGLQLVGAGRRGVSLADAATTSSNQDVA